MATINATESKDSTTMVTTTMFISSIAMIHNHANIAQTISN